MVKRKLKRKVKIMGYEEFVKTYGCPDIEKKLKKAREESDTKNVDV